MFNRAGQRGRGGNGRVQPVRRTSGPRLVSRTDFLSPPMVGSTTASVSVLVDPRKIRNGRVQPVRRTFGPRCAARTHMTQRQRCWYTAPNLGWRSLGSTGGINDPLGSTRFLVQSVYWTF